MLDALTRAGVDTRAIEGFDAPTAATVGLVNGAGNRKFLHRPGVSAQAFSAPLEFPAALVAGMSHYHLASLFILPEFPSARAGDVWHGRAPRGLTTSLDTNWDPRGLWMRDLAPCLPGLDFLFMNEDEAQMVTGKSDAKQAASGGAGARGEYGRPEARSAWLRGPYGRMRNFVSCV